MIFFIDRKKNDKLEEERMAEKIIGYVRNKHDLLSAHDQVLAYFDVTQVHIMKRAQKVSGPGNWTL